MSEPFKLVADHSGVYKASMNPLEGKVGGDQQPLAKELHGLGLAQFVDEGGVPWPGAEEGIVLEGYHWSGIQTQGPSVLGEICE